MIWSSSFEKNNIWGQIFRFDQRIFWGFTPFLALDKKLDRKIILLRLTIFTIFTVRIICKKYEIDVRKSKYDADFSTNLFFLDKIWPPKRFILRLHIILGAFEFFQLLKIFCLTRSGRLSPERRHWHILVIFGA